MISTIVSKPSFRIRFRVFDHFSRCGQPESGPTIPTDYLLSSFSEVIDGLGAVLAALFHQSARINISTPTLPLNFVSYAQECRIFNKIFERLVSKDGYIVKVRKDNLS